MHAELFIFATNTDMSHSEMIFRKRWRIETSYRMINMFFPETTLKIYPVRRLYFYLVVLMRNFWAIIS